MAKAWLKRNDKEGDKKKERKKNECIENGEANETSARWKEQYVEQCTT